MRSVNLAFLSIIAFIAIFAYASGFQISLDGSGISSNHHDSLSREKRELENFDNDADELFTSNTRSESQEEEPGFWDRVISVAIKLFSRFVEWLNS